MTFALMVAAILVLVGCVSTLVKMANSRGKPRIGVLLLLLLMVVLAIMSLSWGSPR